MMSPPVYLSDIRCKCFRTGVAVAFWQAKGAVNERKTRMLKDIV